MKLIGVATYILSALSIIGAFLVTSKNWHTRRTAFILWTIANAGWILYYISQHASGRITIQELLGQLPMWMVYFITSSIGWYQNRSADESRIG